MRMMDVLVIGLGSMGKRRIRLLKYFAQIGNIVGVDEERIEGQKHILDFCVMYILILVLHWKQTIRYNIIILRFIMCEHIRKKVQFLIIER